MKSLKTTLSTCLAAYLPACRAACVLGALLPGISQAGPIVEVVDLIENGEFEHFSSDSSWKGSGWIKADTVPGWSSTEGHIELWQQGVMSSPVYGSDGIATGQHAEITGDSQQSVISTVITIPGNILPGSQGKLSFDVWNRNGQGVTVSLVPDVQLPAPFPYELTPVQECISTEEVLLDCAAGTVLAQPGTQPVPQPSASLLATIDDDQANTAWMRVERYVDIDPGALLTLSFEGIGGGSSGVHIDQVSFLVETQTGEEAQSVPVPATLALFMLGLAGLGIRRHAA